MIIKDRPLVDAKAFKQQCRDLIRLNIPVLLFQAEVRPDYIFRGLHRAAGELVLRDLQAGQMVAVEYHNRRFVVMIQCRGQLFEESIGLMELAEIILKSTAPSFVLYAVDSNCFRTFQRFGGIFSMRLDGNSKDQITPLRRAQRFQNLAGQHAVLRPLQRVIFHVVHIFLGRKGVKAKVGVHAVAAVERCVIVVDRVRAVAKIFQGVGNGIAASVLHDRFIRILAHSEVVQIHTGDHFKLRIGGTRTDGRHIEQARGILLLQRLKIRHRILCIAQIFQEIRIEEGLQLDKYNIRTVFPACRDLPFRLQNGVDLILRIVRRFADALRDGAGREAVGKAVVMVGIRQIGKLRSDGTAFEQRQRRCDQHAAEENDLCRAEIVIRFVLFRPQPQQQGTQYGQNWYAPAPR